MLFQTITPAVFFVVFFSLNQLLSNAERIIEVNLKITSKQSNNNFTIYLHELCLRPSLRVISTMCSVSVVHTTGICPSTLCISLFSLIEYRHPQLPNLLSDPPSSPSFPSFSLPLVLAFAGDSQGAACGCPHRTIVEHKPIVSPNLIIPAFTADAHVSYSVSVC